MKYLFSMFMAILIVVILGGMALWFIGWQKYSSPQVSFSLRYPINWFVCEEFYPNLGEYFLHIDDEKVNCKEGESGKKGEPGLSIYDTGLEVEKSDLKLFLEKRQAESVAQDVKGGLPVSPGFRWQFIKYAGNYFGKRNSSIAEVSGLSESYSTYVMLEGEKIYEIKTIGKPSIVHRIIVFSFGSGR